MLLHRVHDGRAPGCRAAWNPLPCRERRGAVPRDDRGLLLRRVCRGPHAESLPALQPAHPLHAAARAGACARRGVSGDGTLRARGRRSHLRAAPAAPRRQRREGSVVRAARALSAPAAACALPARRILKARGACAGREARAASGRQGGEPRDLLRRAQRLSRLHAPLCRGDRAHPAAGRADCGRGRPAARRAPGPRELHHWAAQGPGPERARAAARIAPRQRSQCRSGRPGAGAGAY